MVDLTPEERGEVLFVLRAAIKKRERELAQVKFPEVRHSIEQRIARMRQASLKLRAEERHERNPQQR